METERRRHTKGGRECFEIEVARPGIRGILSVTPCSECCCNFSRTGLEFGIEEPFEIGEKLVLDIRAFNIEVHELSGEVITLRPGKDNNWCCGVRFCFEEKHMQRTEVRHALLQIEDRLRSTDTWPIATIIGQTAV